jgi:hypothetical protein
MQEQCNLAFEIVHDLRVVVLFLGDENPSDAEWDDYLAAIAPQISVDLGYRVLVICGSGHPTRSQQGRLHEMLGQQRPNVGIISDAVIARFVGSVLALFNPNLRCFSRDQRDAAFGHLELTAREIGVVNAAIARLETRVGAAASLRRAANS